MVPFSYVQLLPTLPTSVWAACTSLSLFFLQAGPMPILFFRTLVLRCLFFPVFHSWQIAVSDFTWAKKRRAKRFATPSWISSAINVSIRQKERNKNKFSSSQGSFRWDVTDTTRKAFSRLKEFISLPCLFFLCRVTAKHWWQRTWKRKSATL